MVKKHAIQRVAEALEQLGIGYEVGNKPPPLVEDSATIANLADCSVSMVKTALTRLRQADGDIQQAIEAHREVTRKHNRTHNNKYLNIHSETIAPGQEKLMGIPIEDIKPKKG